jgi:hypothetical protein
MPNLLRELLRAPKAPSFSRSDRSRPRRRTAALAATAAAAFAYAGCTLAFPLAGFEGDPVDASTRDESLALADAACDGSVCGSSCVDLTSDGENCGACNHSCGGDTCTAGFCPPMSIGLGTGHPGNIVFDGTHVYWMAVSSSATIYSALLADLPNASVETPFASLPPSSSYLATNRSALYWAEGNDVVRGAIVDGGNTTATLLTDSGLTVQTLAAGPGPFHLYVGGTALDGGKPYTEITRQAATGVTTAPLPLFAIPNAGNAGSLISDGANVFFFTGVATNGASLWAVLNAAGTDAGLAPMPLDISDGLQMPGGLTIAPDGTIFWTESGIHSATISDSGTPQTTRLLPIDNISGYHAIAADDDAVYWVGDSHIRRLLRGQTSASDILDLAPIENPSATIAVFGQWIFWNETGVLKMLRK